MQLLLLEGGSGSSRDGRHGRMVKVLAWRDRQLEIAASSSSSGSVRSNAVGTGRTGAGASASSSIQEVVHGLFNHGGRDHLGLVVRSPLGLFRRRRSRSPGRPLRSSSSSSSFRGPRAGIATGFLSGDDEVAVLLDGVVDGFGRLAGLRVQVGTEELGPIDEGELVRRDVVTDHEGVHCQGGF